MPSAEKATPPRGSAQASAGPDRPSGGPAIRSPGAIALLLAVAVAGATADLASKHYVFQSFLASPELPPQVQRVLEHRGDLTAEQAIHDAQLRPFVQRPLMPGVRLTLSTNPGVVFGLRLPRPVVAAATLAALGLVAYLFAGTRGRQWPLHLAMGLILAGAVGNLYDRLFSQVTIPLAGSIRNQVRDFIDCSQLYYPWVFNLADVFLVVGVAILIVHWWRSGPPQPAGKHA